MNEYKKIIKSQRIRFIILRILRIIPNKTMVKIQYKIKMGIKLNLKNPKRYTEKIQWYKLYYHNPIMKKCVDKYEVRQYLESKGLEYILPQLYNVYERVEDIDEEELPEKFVLKTTNGSGTNIFCKNKEQFSLLKYKKKIKSWLNTDFYGLGREWAYKGVKPRIIIEELLEEKESEFSGINDYKFLCFNGKVEYIVLDLDRYVEHKRNIYDKDWNYIDVETDCKKYGDRVEKPQELKKMIEIAEKLSEEFPAVRIDLYCVNNKIYFGEMTFYPWTGYVKFHPDEFDIELGKKFKGEKND